MADRSVADDQEVPFPVAIPLTFHGWQRRQIEHFLKQSGRTLGNLAGKQIIVAATLTFYGGSVRAEACKVKVVGERGEYSAALLQEKRGARGDAQFRERNVAASKGKRALPELSPGDRVTVIGPRVSDHTYEDIRESLSAVEQRGLEVVWRRTTVAGPSAESEIREAVIEARRDSDMVLLYRGGGSEVDVWPFHTAQVADAVSNQAGGAPVLTAIGHKRNKTLADQSSYRAFDVPSQMGTTVRGEYARKTGPSQRHALRPANALREEKAELAEALKSAQEKVVGLKRELSRVQDAESLALANSAFSRTVVAAYADLLDLRRHARAFRLLTMLSIVSALAISATQFGSAPLWTAPVLVPIVMIAIFCERKRSQAIGEVNIRRQRILDGGSPDPLGRARPFPGLVHSP